MDGEALQALFNFIPLLESDALKEAHSVYISTGEYLSPIRELQECLQQSGLAVEGIDWMGSIDRARPFLQSPVTIKDADQATVQLLVALATHSEQVNKSFFPHLCSSGFLLHLLRRIQDTAYH
jgi:hypothetical protein